MEKINTFSQRLQELLRVKDLKAADLCRMTGIDKSSMSRYISGKYVGKQDVVLQIAGATGVSDRWLMGYDVPMERQVEAAASNIIPLPDTVTIPLLGTIACGAPILATENIVDTVIAPTRTRADFALLCKGDSMVDAHIYDGDIVYIRQQDMVDNGQIAAVVIEDGESAEATLKRIHYDEQSQILQLIPCNSRYLPMVFYGPDLDRVRILGKVVGFSSYHVE